MNAIKDLNYSGIGDKISGKLKGFEIRCKSSKQHGYMNIYVKKMD